METKQTKEEHMLIVGESINPRDEAGLRLKIKMCKVVQTETEWLGYHLSKKGIKPVDEKVQVTTKQIYRYG